MPEAFEKCRNTKGSQIRTISGPNVKYKLDKGEYRHICIIGKHGKPIWGEKHIKKDIEEKARRRMRRNK